MCWGNICECVFVVWKKNGNWIMVIMIYKILKLKFLEWLFLFGFVWNGYWFYWLLFVLFLKCKLMFLKREK